jgi:tetratricopeptide (TPR) repeat protein
MSKKIKKRSKKKDEEGLNEISEPEVEPKLEDFVDANDPAMEFGDPTTWDNAGDDEVEVAPLPVGEDGEVDQEALAAMEELTASDQIDMASARVADWAEKNIRLIAAVALVAAIAPILFVIGKGIKDSADVKSAQQISPVFDLYMKPAEGSPELQFFEFNKDFPKPKTFDSQQAKWEAIYKEADSAVAKNPSAGAVYSAKLAKAAAAMRLEKWDESITIYQDMINTSPSAPMRSIAQLGLAQAFSGKKELDKAIDAYEALAKLDKQYEPLATYQKARHQELAGQNDKAKETYHKLLEAHPDTTFKADVERRLALM